MAKVDTLVKLLDEIAEGVYGSEADHVYCEIGRGKPFSVATIKAVESRGYRVVRADPRGKSYRVYPKGL